jgi:hypothetical protein
MKLTTLRIIAFAALLAVPLLGDPQWGGYADHYLVYPTDYAYEYVRINSCLVSGYAYVDICSGGSSFEWVSYAERRDNYEWQIFDSGGAWGVSRGTYYNGVDSITYDQAVADVYEGLGSLSFALADSSE